jgi:hypothetical protein
LGLKASDTSFIKEAQNVGSLKIYIELLNGGVLVPVLNYSYD